MSEAKQARKKGKKLWWVLSQQDEVLVRHYSGPERSRAAKIAEKYLKENPKESVMVAKVSGLAVFDVSALESSLPRNAF
jgi:ElaB/YqjD/DUF883 family membrane-anchored ribosome-binding protein